MAPSVRQMDMSEFSFLRYLRPHLKSSGSFTNSFSGVFDIKSSRFLFVASYTICQLPLKLAQCPASKRWQSTEDYPVCKYMSSNPCQLRLPVTDQCNTNTAEERQPNHCRVSQGKNMRVGSSLYTTQLRDIASWAENPDSVIL
jgi:hypothetical protein